MVSVCLCYGVEWGQVSSLLELYRSTLSIELNNLLLATFSRDTRRRPAANDLLKYPFVVANGAAAEANAAESQAAQRSTPLTRSIRGVLMPNQVSAIEDAADHTLACQAIGILS